MVKIKKYNKNKLTIEVEVDLSLDDSILEIENRIQNASHSVGLLATETLLKEYDTGGEPITVNEVPHWSKGLFSRDYHTQGNCTTKASIYCIIPANSQKK